MPLILDATTKKLQVVVDATATTTESPIVASYIDISSSTTAATVIESDTITTGTTAVDAVAAPAASTQRTIKGFNLYNADTVQHTYTVKYNNNGTLRTLCQVLLATGQTLQYTEQGQWVIIPTYLSIDPGQCEGRLTLTTGVPVTTSDVTGATSIFFTPYKGNRISLYTNSAWTLYTFSEKTLALGTLTSGLPYDVFAFDSGGAVTLELLAWTNGTTRATALVLQDGVYCKSGALTRRYLGTFYTTSTTATEDSVLNRYLWNYYNRIPRELLATDTTTSWTQTSTTFVQRGSKQVNFVVGLQEARVHALLRVPSYSSVGGQPAVVSIGLNNTTSAGTIIVGGAPSSAAAGITPSIAEYVSYPAIGKTSLLWLEAMAISGTATFFGSGGVGWISGILGEIEA